MKKLIAVTIAVFVIGLFITTCAFADITLSMVDNENSFTLQPDATYGWTQKPWLHVNLPSSVLDYTIGWWSPESGSPIFNTFKVTSGVTDVWHGISDWNSARALGKWNIRLDYSSGSEFISKNASFTITPEPISSALFLLGGAGLISRRFLRKRQKA